MSLEAQSELIIVDDDIAFHKLMSTLISRASDALASGAINLQYPHLFRGYGELSFYLESENPPNVVALVDYKLPDVSGVEVATQLLNNTRTHLTMISAVPHDQDLHDRIQMLTSHPNLVNSEIQIIPKPILFNVLADTLKSISAQIIATNNI